MYVAVALPLEAKLSQGGIQRHLADCTPHDEVGIVGHVRAARVQRGAGAAGQHGCDATAAQHCTNRQRHGGE